jgi:hypothetical protein
METTKRYIPPFGNPILYPLLGPRDRENTTEEVYIEKIEAFERKCEESLIETLGKVNINGFVKTDRYSLPYNNEIIVELRGESYLNGAYEFYRVTRKIVKELLEKDLYKVRFYIYVDVIIPEKRTLLNSYGSVKYHFRYHLPK